MTEFDLGGVTLGLMPVQDIVSLVPGITVGSGQRCELYLRRADADGVLARIAHFGGQLLAGSELRVLGRVGRVRTGP